LTNPEQFETKDGEEYLHPSSITDLIRMELHRGVFDKLTQVALKRVYIKEKRFSTLVLIAVRNPSSRAHN
jgi:hypothetical protein